MPWPAVLCWEGAGLVFSPLQPGTHRQGVAAPSMAGQDPACGLGSPGVLVSVLASGWAFSGMFVFLCHFIFHRASTQWVLWGCAVQGVEREIPRVEGDGHSWGASRGAGGGQEQGLREAPVGKAEGSGQSGHAPVGVP